MVKKIIELECNEARFALKPWSLKTTVTKKVDKNYCTCYAVSSLEHQDKEIAEDIDKALLQAQKLREKLTVQASNKKKKCFFESGIKKNILSVKTSHPPKANNLKSNKSNSANDFSKIEAIRKSCKQEKSIQTDNRFDKKNKQRSEDSQSATNTKENKNNFSTENIRGKKTKSNLKLSTKKKPPNFILANKLSVKNSNYIKRKENLKSKNNSKVVSPEQSMIKSRMKNENCYTSSIDCNSTIELNELIKKISSISLTSVRSKSKDCPYHNTNSSTYLKEHVIKNVDATEGLDVAGIPSNLVSILKVHYTYLKSRLSEKQPSVIKKDSVKKFLLYFEKLNEHKENNLLPEELSRLMTNFMNLYATTYDEDMDFVKINRLKVKHTRLDMECKASNWKFKYKFIRTYENKLNDLYFPKDGWLSNGIWNDSLILQLQEMTKANVIRYSDKKQLVTLFDVMQQLQRLEYLRNLIDLILQTIIPKVRKHLSPTSKEYAEVYIMIATIIQILNLKVPVLTRTDV